MMMMSRAFGRMCRLLLAVAVALLPSHAGYDEGTVNAEKFFPASGFPQAEQRRLASRVLGEHWQHDVEAEEYLKRVSRALAPMDEHFVILADADEVNAFAYLGGLVVVYRGLWLFAEEEDGFVGVIAHELGHVKLNHVEKTRENAKQISTLATPLLIAGLLVDDPEVREAVVAGSASIISGDIVAYSRELEHEADIFALETMVERGRNADAMARIFAQLGGGSIGTEHLSTHPAPERRSAYLADRLHNYTPPPPSGALDYYLLREKLSRRNVVEQQYRQSRRAVLAADESAANKLIARYGLLLSATKTRNKALGKEMAEALAGQTHPFIVRALSENLRQRKQSAEALALIQQNSEQNLQHPALVLELFLVNERLKRYRETLKIYSDLPAAMRQRPDTLFAAGRAAAFLKQQVLSNYYLAYGHALDGNFEQAQRQIAIAEKFKGGKTKIVVRLEQLKKKVNRELRLLRERRVLESG